MGKLEGEVDDVEEFLILFDKVFLQIGDFLIEAVLVTLVDSEGRG